ncbi:MAG: hypothetical protein LBT03_01600 [Holosporales bacterium]|nr:hypothetical protein [Holosporales bacterium]
MDPAESRWTEETAECGGEKKPAKEVTDWLGWYKLVDEGGALSWRVTSENEMVADEQYIDRTIEANITETIDAFVEICKARQIPGFGVQVLLSKRDEIITRTDSS